MDAYGYEEGDTVYLPDGTKGEAYQLSHGSDCRVNGVCVEFVGVNGLDRRWFEPEQLHHLSHGERLRRIEERLGLDEQD